MRLKPNGDLRINSLGGTGNNFVFSKSDGLLYTKPFSSDTDKFLTEAGIFRTASSFTGWKMVGSTIHSVSGTYVGIGTNNPQYILDVNGTVRFNGTVNATGINIVNKLQADTLKGVSLIRVNNTLQMTGGVENHIYTTSGDLQLESGIAATGNTLINVYSGNVGVGVYSPQYKFDVNGDARVSGSLTTRRIKPLPGDTVVIIGDSSIYMSGSNRIFIIGNNTTYRGIALGNTNTTAYGLYSLAIGSHIWTTSNADYAIVMGTGITGGPGLRNDIPNSLMIGFNSTVPTIFVAPSTKAGQSGAVCIGGTRIATGSKLSVMGQIYAEDLKVQLSQSWPDYVFESNYDLMNIDSLAEYVNANKHLPDSKPAVDVEQNGMSVSETANSQQKEIEQLTLYILQLNERMKMLEAENADLKASVNH